MAKRKRAVKKKGAKKREQIRGLTKTASVNWKGKDILIELTPAEVEKGRARYQKLLRISRRARK